MTDERVLLRVGWDLVRLVFGAFFGFTVIGAFSLFTLGAWTVPGALLGGLLVGAPQRFVLRSYGQLPPGNWSVTAAGTWLLYALGCAATEWLLEPMFPDLSHGASLVALAAMASIGGALPSSIFHGLRLGSSPEVRRALIVWTLAVVVVCSCLLAVFVRASLPWAGLFAAALVYSLAFELAVQVRARFT